MRKLLIVLCLLVSMPVYSAVPVWFDYDKGLYIDFNPENIKWDKKNKLIYFWTKTYNLYDKYTDANVIKLLKDNDVFYVMDSNVLDCKNNKTAIINMSLYNKNDETVYQYADTKNEDLVWINYPPQRKFGAILQMWCDKNFK